MPDRVIRETILSSQSMARMSPEGERQLVRLWLTCDNHGRFEADPQLVRAKCFPRMLDIVTEEDVAAWLDEIQDAETVSFYEVDEKLYGFHPNWLRSNKLRTENSKYPNPPQHLTHISMRKVMRDRHAAREAARNIVEVPIDESKRRHAAS